jgi:homoserine kinase type II
MEPPDLLRVWPTPEPSAIQPVAAGTNNRTWSVATASGAFVLRLTQNTGDPARIRYEHDLLARLDRAGLSFDVPAPLPTRAGETFVSVAGPDGPALATLTRHIPGRHPVPGDLAQIRACGAALGELDAALGRARVDAPPWAGPPHLPVAGLDRVHPLVPDPLAIPGSLPLSPSRRAALERVLAAVEAGAPALQAGLPGQVIHYDFGHSNVLLQEGRVRGVLDFELAGPGERATDLAAGLYYFVAEAWGTGQEWPRLGAFAAGHAAGLAGAGADALTPAERRAIPLLMRQYRAIALVHRAGRYRQGVAREADVASRAEWLLCLKAWLGRHQDDLVAVLTP